MPTTLFSTIAWPMLAEYSGMLAEYVGFCTPSGILGILGGFLPCKNMAGRKTNMAANPVFTGKNMVHGKHGTPNTCWRIQHSNLKNNFLESAMFAMFRHVSRYKTGTYSHDPAMLPPCCPCFAFLCT